MRKEKPDAYLKIIASILSRDLNVTDNSIKEMGDGELIQRLRELDGEVRPLLDDFKTHDDDKTSH